MAVSDLQEITYIDSPNLERLRVFLQEIAVVLSDQLQAARTKDPISLTDVNSSLWDYLTMLERCILQFIQHLDAVGMESWNDDLLDTATAFHHTLEQNLELFEREVSDLESRLRATIVPQSGVLTWLPGAWQRLVKPMIQPTLFSNLKSSRTFLTAHFSQFANRYSAYMKFSIRAVDTLKPSRDLPLLQGQGKGFFDRYVTLNHLLTVWELDRHYASLLTDYVKRAVQTQMPYESALELFRSYHSGLQRALFHSSRAIKQGGKADAERTRLSAYKPELASLERTIARYRDFLLRTDSNPYVRARWGFPEWVTGPEPETSKRLQRMEFSLIDLDRMYTQFIDKAAPSEEEALSLYEQAQKALHEMLAPTNTRSQLQSYGEKLAEVLDQMNELGSADPQTVTRVGDLLEKALANDDRSRVLHSIQAFQSVLHIHEELSSLNY